MIRLDNISKQNGERLLYVEASAALNRGERIGWWGLTGPARPPCGSLSPAPRSRTPVSPLCDPRIVSFARSLPTCDKRGKNFLKQYINKFGAIDDFTKPEYKKLILHQRLRACSTVAFNK